MRVFVLRLIQKILWMSYRRKIRAERGRPSINGLCRFGSEVEVGRNVHFNGIRCYGRGRITIGDNFHSAVGLRILTQSHNYNGEALPYDRTVVIKNVSIGDNVWIGMDVLILPGVEIGEGAIIQAGAVVSKSIPALAIAGGNPAQVIRFRDAEHYQRLKADGKFL